MAGLKSGALQQLHFRLAKHSAVCTTGTTDVFFPGPPQESFLQTSSLRKGISTTVLKKTLRFRPGSSSGRRRLKFGCGFSDASSSIIEPGVLCTATGMKPATLYDVLGISDMVTDDEIKAAFRRIAKEVHPDQAPPNQVQEYQKKFMEVHKAYSVLKDPRTRSLYNYEIRNSVYNKVVKVEDWKRSQWRGCNWETDQCWTS
ncbi:unnamed protein product [Calypogeia fissa]